MSAAELELISLTLPMARSRLLSASDEVLVAGRSVAEPVLRSYVEGLPEPLRCLAGYHFGWFDARGRIARGAGGKMLRPALTIAATVACGGDPMAGRAASAAVELLHNFTLVHDDVMDVDDTRHGRPTVWRIWGISDALLLGDVLHALAFRVLVEDCPAVIVGAAVSRLADVSVELGRGQIEDCRFETCAWVEVDEYVAMAMGKTGALLGCACALGALCAGADREMVSALDGFGRQLGLAFQFVDDVLGIWGDPAVTGKSVGNDVVRRKRSLPVVAAMASGTAAGRELAELYKSDTPLSATEVSRAVDLIVAAGGRELAMKYAAERAAAAVAALPSGLVAGDLGLLAHRVAHRVR